MIADGNAIYIADGNASEVTKSTIHNATIYKIALPNVYLDFIAIR